MRNFLRSIARKTLPLPVKIKLHKLRGRLSPGPDFAWTLRSGLNVRVASKSDWVIYNDIFVDGEYDPAIRAALEAAPAGRGLNVLDIGANVGFFTLRLIDLMRQGGHGLPPRVTLVEGSPSVVKELSARLLEENQLSESVRIEHGLVGERAGSATIAEHDFHAMNSIFLNRGDAGVKVDFVDLEKLLGDGEAIDLLKCDIEGAELTFLENYPDLLKRVRAAVFELHHERCDTEKCVRILRDAGFTDQRTLRETPWFSVRHFLR